MFCIAFALVFVWLMALPGALSGLMNWAAGLFGLSGDLGFAAGDLDHVLSLSLMACITVLAAQSAHRPERIEPYAALLTAKAVSTGAFAYLAFVEGGAWVLPAVTDGIVIVGLVFARSFASLEPMDRARTSEPDEDGARRE